MENERLAALAEKYGTPAFVFDEEALALRMQKVRAVVGADVRLCYSIKANPFLIPAMLPLTELLEVCSPGELTICEALHVPPERVLLSGVNKTAEDVAHAMDAGVRRFTAESPLHARLIDAAARARGIVVPVILRLTAGTQFGMDEADLRALLENRADFPGLRFEGLHYFAGTQRKKIREQQDELAMLLSLLDTLRAQYGLPLPELEYGPGLYFPYFEHEDASDTLAPLRELAPALREAASACRLTLEMGRFFASECGAYLTRVMDTKVNLGHAYAILDGGIHHVNYIGANMGMRVPRIARIPGAASCGAEPEPRQWTLCGSLCTTADVLVRRIEFERLESGDVLAFLNIGAYSVTEGPALFLSRDLPRVVLADARGDRLARGPLPSHTLNCPAGDPNKS